LHIPPVGAAATPPLRGLRRLLDTIAAVSDAPRYRCTSCGNLTRFDVTTTTRVSALHHFTVGGELSIEEPVVLDERVDEVLCRWCGPSGVVEQVLDTEASRAGPDGS
jgi:hypothetical protein